MAHSCTAATKPVILISRLITVINCGQGVDSVSEQLLRLQQLILEDRRANAEAWAAMAGPPTVEHEELRAEVGSLQERLLALTAAHSAEMGAVQSRLHDAYDELALAHACAEQGINETRDVSKAMHQTIDETMHVPKAMKNQSIDETMNVSTTMRNQSIDETMNVSKAMQHHGIDGTMNVTNALKHQSTDDTFNVTTANNQSVCETPLAVSEHAPPMDSAGANATIAYGLRIAPCCPSCHAVFDTSDEMMDHFEKAHYSHDRS